MRITKHIKTFSNQFWLINTIQTIERLAYWIVLLQMPVYIAQKDLQGGLGWEQSIKGIIFFWWALVQNISPVLTGGLADRFGRKKIMCITSILIILGFLLLSETKSFYPFLFSTMLLGLGMGVFKPALQGEVSKHISEISNKTIQHNASTNLKSATSMSTLGWGLYVTFVNIAYFLGPTFSVTLKNFGWEYVFYGSAVVQSVNLILLLFLKSEVSNQADKKENKTLYSIFCEVKSVLLSTFRNLFRKEIILFVVLITGFTMNHMQFYETLPNFVSDWTDTSSIAKFVPSFMHKETGRGTMISFEWIFNINSTMLLLFVALSSYLTRNKNLLRMCGSGVLLVALGLFLAGRTMDGGLLICGIFMLALGEILIVPRISEYFSLIADEKNRSQYLGYANLAWAFGLSGGGIVGGFLYQHLGEKSSFAIKYLETNFGMTGVEHSQSIGILCSKMGISEVAATELLWHTYNPYYFWFPFLIFGLVCVIGLFAWSRKRN